MIKLIQDVNHVPLDYFKDDHWHWKYIKRNQKQKYTDYNQQVTSIYSFWSN